MVVVGVVGRRRRASWRWRGWGLWPSCPCYCCCCRHCCCWCCRGATLAFLFLFYTCHALVVVVVVVVVGPVCVCPSPWGYASVGKWIVDHTNDEGLTGCKNATRLSTPRRAAVLGQASSAHRTASGPSQGLRRGSIMLAAALSRPVCPHFFNPNLWMEKEDPRRAVGGQALSSAAKARLGHDAYVACR